MYSKMAAIEEWQKEIAELVEAKMVDDAISKAKEIDQRTGKHDEVASFQIEMGQRLALKTIIFPPFFSSPQPRK